MIRIGTLSRLTGVSVQAIRYYERLGLVRPAQRTARGYRLYRPETAGLLGYIKRVQRVGARLEDIGQLLRRRREGRDDCRRLLPIVAKRKAEYEAEMRSLRRKLRGMSALHRLMEKCFREQCARRKRARICPVIMRFSRIRASCANGVLVYPRGIPPFD
jgi:DNA-binding transcriptional MerR regulator